MWDPRSMTPSPAALEFTMLTAEDKITLEERRFPGSNDLRGSQFQETYSRPAVLKPRVSPSPNL